MNMMKLTNLITISETKLCMQRGLLSLNQVHRPNTMYAYVKPIKKKWQKVSVMLQNNQILRHIKTVSWKHVCPDTIGKLSMGIAWLPVEKVNSNISYNTFFH